MIVNIRDSLIRVMRNYSDAKRESFAGHSLAQFVRREIPRQLRELAFINHDEYLISASVGQGNWAAVPWIAIMNRDITTSTQRGYYIVYLFNEDMSEVYLTIAQGVTETTREKMLRIKEAIQNSVPENSSVQTDDHIYLGDSQDR